MRGGGPAGPRGSTPRDEGKRSTALGGMLARWAFRFFSHSTSTPRALLMAATFWFRLFIPVHSTCQRKTLYHAPRPNMLAGYRGRVIQKRSGRYLGIDLLARRTYARSQSIPIHLRPSSLATMQVVPLPTKGSKMIPFLRLKV
jgi:hypothetical protein